ncbi:MAG TPA: hypothetical protein VGH98_01500 [Gemmatimonadaceae bacterium]|jgi:hypothetical protein
MRSLLGSLLLPAVVGSASLAIVAATPSSSARLAGPPWISIEYPANPLDPSTRGAYLLVHAFHHQIPISSPVRGTAEGVVNGERKSITLHFDTTSRPSVYALRKQWSDNGVWSPVISVAPHEDNIAQALIELSPDGGISSVRVPTRREREWTIPRLITAQEIEQSLQSRTPRTAQARR